MLLQSVDGVDWRFQHPLMSYVMQEPSRPEELRHLLDESRARIDEARRVNSDLQVRSSDEVVLRTLARHLELDLAEHAVLETRSQEVSFIVMFSSNGYFAAHDDLQPSI